MCPTGRPSCCYRTARYCCPARNLPHLEEEEEEPDLGEGGQHG